MSKHVLIGSLLVGAALLVSGAGYAAPGATAPANPPAGPPRGQSMMERMDANHDGKISYDEFRAAHEQRAQREFKQIDANGDNVVTEDELRTARERMRDMHRARMEQQRPPQGEMPWREPRPASPPANP